MMVILVTEAVLRMIRDLLSTYQGYTRTVPIKGFYFTTLSTETPIVSPTCSLARQVPSKTACATEFKAGHITKPANLATTPLPSEVCSHEAARC